MTEKLRLGLAGADATGKAWAPIAHIPAISCLEEIEPSVVCTSSPESAAGVATACGVEHAFHDVGQMVSTP